MQLLRPSWLVWSDLSPAAIRVARPSQSYQLVLQAGTPLRHSNIGRILWEARPAKPRLLTCGRHTIPQSCIAPPNPPGSRSPISTPYQLQARLADNNNNKSTTNAASTFFRSCHPSTHSLARSLVRSTFLRSDLNLSLILSTFDRPTCRRIFPGPTREAGNKVWFFVLGADRICLSRGPRDHPVRGNLSHTVGE